MIFWVGLCTGLSDNVQPIITFHTFILSSSPSAFAFCRCVQPHLPLWHTWPAGQSRSKAHCGLSPQKPMVHDWLAEQSDVCAQFDCGKKKHAPARQYWFAGHIESAVQPPGFVQMWFTHMSPKSGQSLALPQKNGGRQRPT